MLVISVILVVLVTLVKKFCPEADDAAGGGSSQLTCTDVVSRAEKRETN